MVASKRSKRSARRCRVLPIDKALERKRLALDLSMCAAARAVGVNATNYHNWCARGVVPHLFFLPQIATFLEATMSEVNEMRDLMAQREREKRAAALAAPALVGEAPIAEEESRAD